MELNHAIKNRHSVRKFNEKKKPDWRNLIECIDSMRYSPMMGNNYTLRVILVDNEEKIAKIAEATQQQFVAQAKFVVVVCSDDSRPVNLYGDKAKVWARQQAGAAIQNFLLSAEEYGLGACWVGHFVEDQIKSLLKIPENIVVEAVLPVGYEYEKPRTRRLKIDLDRVLFFNSYGNKKMKHPRKVSD